MNEFWRDVIKLWSNFLGWFVGGIVYVSFSLYFAYNFASLIGLNHPNLLTPMISIVMLGIGAWFVAAYFITKDKYNTKVLREERVNKIINGK